MARTISHIGDFMSPVALAFAVLSIGGTATDLGLVSAAYLAPWSVLVLFGGVVADRASRRNVMIAADSVRAISQAAFALALLTGTATVPLVVALQFVRGVAAAFFSPSMTGIVPELVSEERLQPAIALQAVSLSSANIAGPALAGGIVVALGPGWAVGIDALTFAASAVLLSRLPASTGRSAWTADMTLRDLAAGWRALLDRRWLWIDIVNFSLFASVPYTAFYVLGPLIARDHLDGAAAWGLILAAGGVGAVVGSVLGLRLRPARPLAVAEISFLGFVPQLVALALAPSTLLVGMMVLLGSASVTFANILRSTTLQRVAPPELLSRLSSYAWLPYAISPLGYLIIGGVAEATGLATTLLASATLLALASTISATSSPILRVRFPRRSGE